MYNRPKVTRSGQPKTMQLSWFPVCRKRKGLVRAATGGSFSK
jgi:hypothetical protein